MKPAYYKYWLATNNWSFYQLTFLVRGFEPVPMARVDVALQSEIREALNDMENWAEAFWESHGLVPPLEFGHAQCPLEWTYDSTALIIWAKSLPRVNVPTELLSHIDQNRGTPETKKARSPSKREQDNISLILGALLDLAKLNTTNHSSAAKKIKAQIERQGIDGPGVETIVKRLNEIPRVMEGRKI